MNEGNGNGNGKNIFQKLGAFFSSHSFVDLRIGYVL